MIQFDLPRKTIKLQKLIRIPEETSFDFEGDWENTIDPLTGMSQAVPECIPIV